MKKTITLALLFFSSWFEINAQNKKLLDSIAGLIRTSKTDTARINYMLVYAENFVSIDPDSTDRLVIAAEKLIENLEQKGQSDLHLIQLKVTALTDRGYINTLHSKFDEAQAFYFKAIVLAEKHKLWINLGDCYNNLGELCFLKGSIPEAIPYFEKAIFYHEKSKDINKWALALNNLAVCKYSLGKRDEAIGYYMKAAGILEKNKKWKDLSVVYNNVAVLESQRGNSKKALEIFQKVLDTYIKIGDQKGIALTYNNMAAVMDDLGDIKNALTNYHRARKISEQYNFQETIGKTLFNIGSVHEVQGDLDVALDFYLKSLKIFIKTKTELNIAQAYNNIGGIYKTRKAYQKSLSYYFAGLKITETSSALQEKATLLNNIGSVYDVLLQFDSAVYFYSKAIPIVVEQNDLSSQAIYYANLGGVYNQKKDLKKALEYAKKSLELSKSVGFPKNIRQSADLLWSIYKKTGNYKEALEMHELYVKMRDSLNNKANQRTAMKQQLQLDFEIKSAADSVKTAEYKKVRDAEQKQEKTQRYALYGGLALVLIFSGFLYNRFNLTRKQKNIIEGQKEEVENQKHIVEEKQKEIIDSISYAKRLQEAILPPEKFIKQHFPESFIYYQPKDIVAGDFYWMEHLDEISFIAAADSTGHGVPGAMVSLVCSNALNRAVKEFGLRDTGKILDKVTDLVLETFEKSDSEVKDGMDISLIAIHHKKKKAYWSGANNPLWYIVNGEFKEIKADKQPIGKSDHRTNFTSNEITIEENSEYFLLTDGYPDQFGGPKGKKYKYQQLKDLLQQNFNDVPENQKRALENSFQTWRGQLEQVDDVTIIGLKV